MKVIFSHGKESGPWGSKIRRLADIAKAKNCEVDSIDYTGLMDPDQRVELLEMAIQKETSQPICLVGSSMGGYVSTVASSRFECAGLFLLAPALFIEGYGHQTYSSKARTVSIVHGWDDDIIPVENSFRFAQTMKCSLHLIAGDHRLNSSIDEVATLFDNFLATVTAEN